MIPIKDSVYIHGEYLARVGGDKNSDAYVACIKSLEDGHSELKIIENPETKVWVAKPGCRRNIVKRELAEKKELDMYRCRVNNIAGTLWMALNCKPGQWRQPPFYVRLKEMLSSPYVYGADIDYGVHLKLGYKRANGGRAPLEYNVGALDIETDVHGSDQVIVCTYMNGDGHTYTGILKEFFLDHTTQEVEDYWSKKIEPMFVKQLNKKGLAAYKKYDGIKLHLKIFDKEVDLIKWIFDRIHECKPDFCGIWNMDYDIPWIIKRLEFRQCDPAQVMCHPDVPYKFRYCKYKADPGKKDGHMTDKWSWFSLPDYTRYYDAMCLYGRLRKAKPREPSYKLDAIGGKEIGAGKMSFDEFGDEGNHDKMQRFHQVEYTVYNIVDVLIMHVMEIKNSDVTNMMQLIGSSTLDCFAHQSIQLKNYFFEYLDERGCIPASIGNRIDDKWDYMIHNKGGAVLSPDKALMVAVPALTEDDVVLRACRNVCDIDVTSMYPSLLKMLNCSKETKLFTVLLIDNSRRKGIIDVETIQLQNVGGKYKTYDVNDFFLDAIYTEANAMDVGKRFNLPGYQEVDEWMKKRHPEIIAA